VTSIRRRVGTAVAMSALVVLSMASAAAQEAPPTTGVDPHDGHDH